jgi:uncharacterized protein (DUF983 family)
MAAEKRPNYFWSIFTMKCPRCRHGHMFKNPNPWRLKEVLKMNPHCEECNQQFELEVGFWYGTGYVSYALTVAFSVATLVAWWVIIGLSTTDNRFFWWVGINAALLIFLQPWIMRLSRVVYLYFFVRYDPMYKETNTKTFDYTSEEYYKKPEDAG